MQIKIYFDDITDNIALKSLKCRCLNFISRFVSFNFLNIFINGYFESNEIKKFYLNAILAENTAL